MRTPLLALAAALAVFAAACSDRERPAAGVDATPGSSAALQWSSCGGRAECATLQVPLDWADPAGETIELSVIRYPARKPDQRIGVLMANPGGPGGSAIDFMKTWQAIAPAAIRDRFDLVAFDPRGVGESTPIVCHQRLQELVAVDPDPETDAEWRDAERVSKAFADDCAAAAGRLLPYVGTKNVARDMDALRQALGEEQLTYVGYSYGTTIGAVYADMFPGRVRAFVLDGGTDQALDYETVSITQMIGFERALQAYLADCAAKRCALARDGDPRAAIDRVIAMAEQAPIPAPGADRPAGPGEVQLGIIAALYSKFTWNQLTGALTRALGGDGTGLVELTDFYLQRNPDGTYPNLIEANYAVNSVDSVCPRDPQAYRAMADRFAKLAPTFGRAAATSGLVCAYWAAEPDPLGVPRAAGAPPILVIATTNDPATPYEWGKALSEQLESGVLLTYRGEGHTIYAQGSACVDEIVNAYLLNLAVPAAGATCGDGPPPPGQQAGPTAAPRTEATPTRSARLAPTPAPAGAAEPPAANDGGDEGETTPPPPETDAGSGEPATWGYWVAGLLLLAMAVAFVGVGVAQARRGRPGS
ncbi:MAG: proteinase [Tepidiforma sp.]|nr:alpha/beta hydrolase [Tepidiforma sp.]GIW18986.1 MAG: proteinase [Tepidiforma sp.]